MLKLYPASLLSKICQEWQAELAPAESHKMKIGLENYSYTPKSLHRQTSQFYIEKVRRLWIVNLSVTAVKFVNQLLQPSMHFLIVVSHI